MIRRRIFLVLAALVLAIVPGVAASSAVADEGSALATSVPSIGPSGQHLVCYAPGFTHWVVCIDYP